ncbi:hypothetical protein FRX31_009295 [Thalictrum thalictroides]|uniref:Uncharacterized protein n=1 Tax=Thalictrum thalictroides TaxID=46969 RepID=A0A7J6WUL5_THATH|nr:hypothetical protein FRX31_009295 [Thalictrum thalictroides]
MFSSTVEFIGLISSSTLLMFGFCNLIIVILIVSNLKSNTPQPHYETSACVTVIPKRIENDQIQDIEASSDMVVEVPNVDEEEDKDDEDVQNDDDHQEVEDELRRKVEAFIEKINRAWKEEKLGISPYVQREQPYGHLATSTLVNNSKSDSAPSHSETSVCVAASRQRIEKEQIKESAPLVSIDIEASSSEIVEKKVVVHVPTVGKEPVIEKIDEEEEEQDELRKRVEEFIAKINTTWKAEKLGNFSPYVHREQLHGHLGVAHL